MKKAIAVVIGVLALTFATMGAAMAARGGPTQTDGGGAPTQSGSMYCDRNGDTVFTATAGSVKFVKFRWSLNGGGYYDGTDDYSAPYAQATVPGAKVGYTTVHWASDLETTYSKACK